MNEKTPFAPVAPAEDLAESVLSVLAERKLTTDPETLFAFVRANGLVIGGHSSQDDLINERAILETNPAGRPSDAPALAKIERRAADLWNKLHGGTILPVLDDTREAITTLRGLVQGGVSGFPQLNKTELSPGVMARLQNGMPRDIRAAFMAGIFYGANNKYKVRSLNSTYFVDRAVWRGIQLFGEDCLPAAIKLTSTHMRGPGGDNRVAKNALVDRFMPGAGIFSLIVNPRCGPQYLDENEVLTYDLLGGREAVSELFKRLFANRVHNDGANAWLRLEASLPQSAIADCLSDAEQKEIVLQALQDNPVMYGSEHYKWVQPQEAAQYAYELLSNLQFKTEGRRVAVDEMGKRFGLSKVEVLAFLSDYIGDLLDVIGLSHDPEIKETFIKLKVFSWFNVPMIQMYGELADAIENGKTLQMLGASPQNLADNEEVIADRVRRIQQLIDRAQESYLTLERDDT